MHTHADINKEAVLTYVATIWVIIKSESLSAFNIMLDFWLGTHLSIPLLSKGDMQEMPHKPTFIQTSFNLSRAATLWSIVVRTKKELFPFGSAM